MEWLISELLFVNRAALRLDAATLHKHSWDHAVNLSALVADLLASLVLKALAKLQEVVNCFRADVLEKFEDNGWGFIFNLELKFGIFAGLRAVNLFLEAVFGHLFVVTEARLVFVVKVVESPGLKIITVSYILFLVKVDEGTLDMVVEDTLKLVGSGFDELLPLALEEFHNADLNAVGVHVAEGLSNNVRALEFGVGRFASHSNMS
jgi:hypothetical protein